MYTPLLTLNPPRKARPSRCTEHRARKSLEGFESPFRGIRMSNFRSESIVTRYSVSTTRQVRKNAGTQPLRNLIKENNPQQLQGINNISKDKLRKEEA